jgi:hypothetical protein
MYDQLLQKKAPNEGSASPSNHDRRPKAGISVESGYRGVVQSMVEQEAQSVLKQ